MTYALAAATIGNLTYSYDQVGRRIAVGGTLARTGLPLPIVNTSYDASNRLIQCGAINLFYDANGNMASDGTHNYAWDARNHLTKIDSGTTANFTYDPFGRRTSKTISGTQTGFLYDGANPVQELSGTTVTANSLMGGVDEVFQRTDAAGARSFLTDALGSTLALTDSSGMTQTTYSFDAFGNTTLGGSSTTNSFAYTGREIDAGNLQYYRARYYSPQFQRFISEDPIGLSGGDANFYAYAGNSPINFIDPSGTSNPIVHLLETYDAGRASGLGIGASLNLAVQATLVDVGTQGLDAPNTNLHAMAGSLPDGSYETPEQAFNGAAAVVDSNGAALGAIDPFAIHTIEDSYSASHNYQPDRDPFLGVRRSHFVPDEDYHFDAIDAVTRYINDRKANQDRDPRCYLKSLAGRKKGC